MNYKLFPALMACSGLLLSCGSAKKAAFKYKTLDTVTVSARNNPINIYRASETKYWEILHTRVALSFNMKEKTADGKAWLELKPYFYETDSLVLDAKSMETDSVLLIQGKSASALEFRAENDKLKIYFPEIIHRDQQVKVYIRYTAKPYAGPAGGSEAISEDRGLYFINTDQEVPGKPVQIWTQGETEANSHWLPVLDKPNQRTLFDLELTVPDSLITLSNGIWIKSEKKENSLRTDYWSIKKPVQVYALMFAVGNFKIVEDTSWNHVPVTYYVEPEYEPFAKKMFQNTPEMIDYFSKITGIPYPWNKYSQIVVRDYVSGAMENTTASLFGEFMNQNFREIEDKNYEDVVAHELFHQWFGDYVTTESWSNITVNESFATYGEYLWRKNKYGPASADRLFRDDLNQYLDQTGYNDDPLVRFHYLSREAVFDRISYQKGGVILKYLNGLTGNEAFSRAMNIYLSQNALQSAEAHHWRLAVEKATGMDWNWFFNQWYFRGGHPVLKMRYRYDADKQELVVNVRQTASDSGKVFDLPLKAALIYGNETEIIDWNPKEKSQDFSFPYRNGLKPVFIPDYESWLPGRIEENKSPAEWLVQLEKSTRYIHKVRAVSGAFEFQNDRTAQQLFRAALRDSLSGVRAYALGLLPEVTEKSGWKNIFKNEIIMMALNDGNREVRANAFQVLGTWKVNTILPEMIAALNDSSYLVAGNALKALESIYPDTAYFFAKQLNKESPRGQLQEAIWNIIGSKGNAADTTVFTEKRNRAGGRSKIYFAHSLGVFAVQTEDIPAFERCLEIITHLAATENIKPYRAAIGAGLFEVKKKIDQGLKEKPKNETEILRRQKQALTEKYIQKLLDGERDPEIIQKYHSME